MIDSRNCQPKTQVVVQFPANATDLRFRGLRVFLESTGDADRDARMIQRFNWLVDDMMREREDMVLGANYGKNIAKL